MTHTVVMPALAFDNRTWSSLIKVSCGKPADILYKPVPGVSGSVPHGGFFTLLATGEVIPPSSGIFLLLT